MKKNNFSSFKSILESKNINNEKQRIKHRKI